MNNKIICGDALAVLKTLPSDGVNCCVTSPPYYLQRDYGVAGQIGQERSPDEYIRRLTEVFHEVRRVLAPDGTLWINIADVYAAFVPKHWPKGIKTKDMLALPWSLAIALRQDGWYLRSDIIWRKTNAMPNSVTDRPVSSYEHVFVLAKSKKYYFDYKALEMPVAESTKRRTQQGFNSNKYTEGVPGQNNRQSIFQPRPGCEPKQMRRGRDIWDIGSSSVHNQAHFAVFPVELARRCIAAGCSAGGTVLDPFSGAGTTGVAANMLGRNYIGIDICLENCHIAEKRLEAM